MLDKVKQIFDLKRYTGILLPKENVIMIRTKDKVTGKAIICDLLEQQGMTKIAFAEKLGMSRQNLNSYLNGTQRDLNIETFVAMLDILGYEIQILPKHKI